MDADVIVIGAGLSGLACALELMESGLRPLVLEAAMQPGGRIATDQVDGFRLDRGFQVLQTWYPAARHWLDYDALDLRPFYPGALVRIDGRFHRVSDIWRRPGALAEMLRSPVGTLGDKLRLLRLRRRALAGDLEHLYARRETDAPSLLRGLGFSEQIIERFFRPFFSGVFFEPSLAVSSRAFEFVFRAFALGDTALPAHGMGEIPRQLAARLPPDCIRYGQRCTAIEDQQVILADGGRCSAAAIVIATDGGAAAQLLGRPAPPTRGTTCFYFAATRAPIDGPYLVLAADGSGPINSLLCPSNLAPAYAPPGQALVTVNCFDSEAAPESLEPAVRQQLGAWFGAAAADWRLLQVYQLRAALPGQAPPVTALAPVRPVRPGLWVCGELVAPPSIHWALASGEATAAAVLAAYRDRP
ncbi:MAG: FAD-binding protein [Chromatiaceae bacterium]|nr:MAG: FAD-binding protein [Chromatiaceae bacterium]